MTDPGPSAAEQAAQRRVATLVARGAQSEVVFAAVAEEVAALCAADIVAIIRYERGGESTVVSGHGRAPFEPGAPSSVSAPILVEGRTWGVIGVGSRRGRLAPGTGPRLASFTELVATAIAGAQARLELRRFAEEQAALRRVATLVARAAPPEVVLAAVTEEAGRLLDAAVTVLGRFDPDGQETTVGVWSAPGTLPVTVGSRTPLGGRNMSTLVFQTGQPARIDDYADASGPFGTYAQAVSMRASVGVPISVEGRLWGVMIVASAREPLPAGTEERLAGFTELAGTAIANAQARTELRGFAEEQSALRRVATLVARAAPPEEVFAAVTAEAGRLLDADLTSMSRYEPDGARTLAATWASTGAAVPLAAGTRFGHGGHTIGSLVFQTGQPARIDDLGDGDPVAGPTRELLGIHAAVGVPVRVGGRLWGIVSAMSQGAPLPADAEARLARFTELAATAIANAEARAALVASRARIVAAADAARRRIEQDLHDSAQERLVALVLQLRGVQAAAPAEADELVRQLETVIAEAIGALEALSEIARGLHPSVLADGGLPPALTALARRSAIPVRLDVRVPGRLPEPAELAAYYAVSEALTNTAKHAGASGAEVEVAAEQGMLRVWVRDDGRGGADSGGGSGLTGLRDRIEAIGGRMSLHSPPGAGTAVEIALPLADPAPVAG
jgi:signal transduction histidine kinase